MTITETTIETAPVKIKVQKRTPTERQLEALEKARHTKQKKKIETIVKKEIQDKENPFLMPSPYLMGTIMLGLGGLVAYSYLKQEQSSYNTQETSYIPTPEAKHQPLIQLSHIVSDPLNEAVYQQHVESLKTQSFFANATTI